MGATLANESRGGLLESPIYSQEVRNTGDSLDSALVSEVGVSDLVTLNPSPVGSDATLSADSVRMELNCRTSSWCWGIAWWGKGKPTLGMQYG